MRLIRHLAILALLLSPAVPCLAGAETGATLKEVVAALEQGYKALEDVQADFSQRTTIASMKREERGSGELFIKRPAGASAMFRFNYKKPRQQIVSDGKRLWYYLPDNRQVMVGDVAAMFEGGNGVALNYLTGMGNVSRDFAASFVGDGRDKRGDYVLELVPRKQSQVLARLHLTVSARAVEQFLATGQVREAFPIVSSVMYDQFGTRTAIDFSRVRVNRGVPSDRFTFRVPAGVEVIKTR